LGIFCDYEQWRRVSSTRRRENPTGNRGAVTASSPLPFHAGGEEIYHLQQKENAQTAMGFVFLDLSGSNSFSLLCLFSFCQ
jgi:hypothetical protein